MELISAIATPQGAGGVAIVRVSGDGALSLARKMFSRRGEYVPNVLYPGKIDCGNFFDFGMCVYFQSPHSFTGEDVVEFHCHGGVEIVRLLLKHTFALGARQALPGEFTRRAYLNGKLSLSAVEGLGEMISAQSLSEVRAGFTLYSEKLTKIVQKMQDGLRFCLAKLDADVDYPEEDLKLDVCASIKTELGGVEDELEALLRQYPAGKKIKAGVKVALCGRPNAGKSSLLNALLGYPRAIVTDEAGTTRDLVEENLEIHGVLFRIIDTAGLRDAHSDAEREGVRRAKEAFKSADIVLYLKEAEDEIDLPAGVPVITVGAKCDLKRQDGCEIFVSSKTGEGVEGLKELLFSRGMGEGNDGVFLLEERHHSALLKAKEHIARTLQMADGSPSELVAEELKSAYLSLGTITGESATEDILEEIFSRFCVGK